MTRKASAEMAAAQRQYERAPADSKPSAAELAKKHNLHPSSIHRTAWYKPKEKANAAA